MEKIQIADSMKHGKDGRPVLRLIVQGREVEARFAEEANPELCPRLKEALFNAFLQSIEGRKHAC